MDDFKGREHVSSFDIELLFHIVNSVKRISIIGSTLWFANKFILRHTSTACPC
jgi:hypothetical protein